jgi:Flp pilus assembly CpaE family ATPase
MNLGLDLTNVNGGGNVSDPGDYIVTCKKAEVKETRDGTGKYINALFETDRGQTIWHMFNIENKSQKATDIGRAQLKEFMRVGGKLDPNTLNDVTELCGLTALARVKIQSSDNYGEQPRITSFKKLPKTF